MAKRKELIYPLSIVESCVRLRYKCPIDVKRTFDYNNSNQTELAIIGSYLLARQNGL